MQRFCYPHMAYEFQVLTQHPAKGGEVRVVYDP